MPKNCGDLPMAQSMLLPDFKDLLKSLNDHNVRYLVVGGYAVITHGYARATKSLDAWLAMDAENASRISGVLLEFFGKTLSKEQLCNPRLLLRIGTPPAQVEFFTSISGVTFDDAYRRAIQIDIDGITVPVLSLEDLWTNKTASARPQDLADLDNLPEPGTK